MTDKFELITPTDYLESLLELINPTEPKYKSMVITPYAWAKILCYINLIGEYEITGFGKCEVEDTTLKLTDVKILRQVVKSASVDCDLDSMQEFLLSIPKEERGQWILDWHSHVNMGTFYSGTDTTNYQSQWEARLKKQYPVMVVNKRNEITCGCYIRPERIVPIEVELETMTHSLTAEQITELYNQCYEDVATLCSKSIVTNYYSGNNYPFTGSSSWYNKYTDYDDFDSGFNNKKKESTIEESEEEDSLSYWKNQAEKYRQVGNESLANECEIISDKWKVKSGLTKIDETNGRKQLSINDYCISCGTYLVETEEYDRGLCDDCWEQMTYQERLDYKNKFIN